WQRLRRGQRSAAPLPRTAGLFDLGGLGERHVPGRAARPAPRAGRARRPGRRARPCARRRRGARRAHRGGAGRRARGPRRSGLAPLGAGPGRDPAGGAAGPLGPGLRRRGFHRRPALRRPWRLRGSAGRDRHAQDRRAGRAGRNLSRRRGFGPGSPPPRFQRMRAFAELLDRLSLTGSRNAKLTLVRDYLAATPDPDRGWALAALTGELVFHAAKPGLIRKAVEERMDPILFRWSYDYVGDLAETVALVWPRRPGANREPELSEVVEALRSASRAEDQRLIEGWLDALEPTSRWALLKLMTGELRVGFSARLAKQAAADLGRVPVAEVEEVWHALHPPYEDLFAWLEGRSDRPSPTAPGRFRPVMLAQAIDEAVDSGKLDPADYAAEWKWDGIRVQAVSEGGVRRLY